jgi:hypothetical protein
MTTIVSSTQFFKMLLKPGIVVLLECQYPGLIANSQTRRAGFLRKIIHQKKRRTWESQPLKALSSPF